MLRVRGVLCVAAAAGSVGAGIVSGQSEQKVAFEEYVPRTTTTIPIRALEVAIAEVTTSTASTLPPTTAPRVRVKAAAKPKPTGDGLHDENKKDTRPVPKPTGLPLGSPYIGAYSGPDIEGFARYEGQSTCDPTPKSGTLALRDVLLARYPSTKSLGVSRDCAVGGQSEHKEGRAFDWGADINDPSDVAAVTDFLNALFATDAEGHRYALARRMGVMYVIWNQQIWGAYSAKDGWRPYDGANPHTDHAHISLSWEGGLGKTSFWSGTIVPGLPDIFKPKPTTTTTTRPRRTTTTWRHGSTTSSTSTTLLDGETTTSIADQTTTTSVADEDVRHRRRR